MMDEKKKNMYFRDTSTQSLLSRISASVSGCTAENGHFFTHHGDIIQYTVRCAGMPKYKTEETLMAAHAVSYDRVRGRYCVLLSHHRR